MLEEIVVITGDIVASSATTKSERSKLLRALKGALKHVVEGNTHFRNFNITRGDSFQVALDDPLEVMQSVLEIRASIKKIEISNKSLDVRMGIGFGDVSFVRAKVSESDGVAFHLAAEALEACYEGVSNIYLRANNPSISDYWNTLFEVAEYIISGWSAKEAALVFESLQGLTQLEIAEKFDVSQSTVQRGLKRAGWGHIQSMLELYAKHPLGQSEFYELG